MNTMPVSTDNTKEHPGPVARWWAHEHRVIEEITLASILALVLIGIAITNISPIESYRYWIAMIVLFATAGLIIGAVRARRDLKSIPRVMLDQIVHWGATLTVVVIVYMMLNAGRLNYEAAGLVVLLLLGLAMFLDGYYRVGWRFSLLGILVVLMALGAAYLTAFVWPILILGAVIWPLTIMAEIYLTHHKDKKERTGQATGSPKQV